MLSKSIFKNKNFMILWLGQLVSKIGDHILEFALAWYIYDQTNSTLALSLSIISIFLPNAIVSTFSGVVADRFNRKKIIIICDTLNGLFIFLLFIRSLYAPLTLPVIIIANISIAIVSSLFYPAISSSTQSVLETDQLQDAGALSQLQGRFAIVAGSAIAGFMLKLVGIEILLFINALSFIFSAISESFVKIPVNHKVENTNISMIDSLKEAAHFMSRNRVILYLTLFAGIIANGMFMSVSLYMPAIFKDILGKSSIELGIYYSIEGALGIITSVFLLLSQKKLQPYKWTVIALFLEGLCLSGIGLMPNLSIAYIIAALSGFCFTICSVTMSILFRKLIPNKLMGRVGSFNMLLSNLAIPVFTVFFGFIGDIKNPQTIVLYASFVFLISLIPAPFIFSNASKSRAKNHM
jgi:MFS family permease